jgi:hypothetical protein
MVEKVFPIVSYVKSSQKEISISNANTIVASNGYEFRKLTTLAPVNDSLFMINGDANFNHFLAARIS